MNKYEKAEKLVNEEYEEIKNNDRMTTMEKVYYMIGFVNGLTNSKQLHAGDVIDLYLRMQDELGVRLLP